MGNLPSYKSTLCFETSLSLPPRLHILKQRAYAQK